MEFELQQNGGQTGDGEDEAAEKQEGGRCQADASGRRHAPRRSSGFNCSHSGNIPFFKISLVFKIYFLIPFF